MSMMNAIPESITVSQHWQEWQRIELLCQCLLQSRQGVSEEMLKALQEAQSNVDRFRQTQWWQQLNNSSPLTHFALDVLCCVYAPQIIGRIGWLYQELQGQRSALPCESLIASLLALPDEELESLRVTLQSLERDGLIQRSGQDPLSPIHPDKLALSRLMSWTEDDYAPPGSFRLNLKVGWDDLVLPAEQQQMLREYLYWIQHKHTVEQQWQGQKTGGPIALFTGPPGTGKTLAASVLANELQWPLFRVDLSALVSKYVGETEKNIGRLFDATHGRQVFLQFDEVDALMGKRGELKEARDRYANMEVSYLLSRIEQHDGPCILTTNLRSQIDKAFCRRFQMVVEFPRPDVEQRLQLWQKLIPAKAPITQGLQWQSIAEAITLTGGQIKNAALHAAYLAAAQSESIGIHHIATAIYRELGKTQAQVNPSSLGLLANYLPTATGNKS